MSLEELSRKLLKANPEVARMVRQAGKEEKERYEQMLAELTGSEEYKVVQRLRREQGLSPREVLDVVSQLKKQKPISEKNYSIGKNHVKYMVIGDTHMGNIEYDSSLMKFAHKVAKDEGVDFVVHTGDILDGWYQNRPTALFEQNAIGVDQQLKLAEEELSGFKGMDFYFITGNHEYNTFMRGAGVEIGYTLEDRLKKKGVKAKFMGNADGEIKLRSGTRLQFIHPDGGTAYALSYRMQKIAESLSGGDKPHVLHSGHFHKAEYLFYRNIHIFQTGCFEGQTKFMKGKNISAHKGFWVIDLYTKKGGQVDKIIPQFFPSYEK